MAFTFTPLPLFALTFLAACLAQTVAAGFIPVYGSLSTRHAVQVAHAAILVLSALAAVIKPYPHIPLSFRTLCRTTCILASLTLSLERALLFPYSAALGPLCALAVLLLPLYALSMRIGVEMAADAEFIWYRKRYGMPVSASRGDYSMSVANNMGMMLLYLGWNHLLSFIFGRLAACFPRIYFQIATLVGSRAIFKSAIVLIFGAFLCTLPPRPAYSTWLISLGLVIGGVSYASRSQANSVLRHSGYRILERAESITGYVSVLENTNDHFLALRCDHSLLGGQWELTAERLADGIVIPESIYSVFYTLEAVRLIERDDGGDHESSDATDSIQSSNAQTALVIGLGIGTSPNALAAHGINVTAVEIDPIVVKFATKYFGLDPAIHTITQDALEFAARAADHRQTFDYIIHDVFTGGSEPKALFQTPFLHNLRSVLKPGGSIVLNWAGDITSAAAHAALSRIVHVFENCRVFRDDEPREETGQGPDFANVMVFCVARDGPLTFRMATEADFLRSRTRRDVLVPRYEIEMESYAGEDHMAYAVDDAVKSAEEHWRIMRTVIPAVVWENW